MDEPRILTSLPINDRREKRNVPDTEKDDRYWEKRKRNNLAAKKSREIRRQHEILVRGRVQALEEENALLKQELRVIKQMCNIPSDFSVLSDSEKEMCLRQVRESQAVQPRPRSVSEPGNHNSSPIPDVEKDDYKLDMREHGNQHVVPLTPAYAYTLQHYAESSKRYLSEIQEHSGRSGFKKARFSEATGSDLKPADLSMKKLRQPDDKQTSGAVESWNNANLGKSKVGVNTGSCTNDDMLDCDLKSKLQLLTEQVKQMQQLVC